MRSLFLAASLLASGAVADDSFGADDVYIEFLWAKAPEGSLARQETRSFVLDSKFDHQVCVAVLRTKRQVRKISIETIDSAGNLVSRDEHENFDGSKRCFSASLPAGGNPGKWTYMVYMNDESLRAGEKSVEVFSDLAELLSRLPADMPYVLGRPNYDSSISPEEFIGKVSWIMHVDSNGKVINVELDGVEGVGSRMAERALAAGYLSLFPPLPAGQVRSTFRRELVFSNDE